MKPLKDLSGRTLKLYVVMIGTGQGVLQIYIDIHHAVAYSTEEAIAETRKQFQQTNSTAEFIFEIKKIIPITDLLRMLRENIDDQIFKQEHKTFVRQPKYKSEEAVKFLEQIIKVAPALEPEETEQWILIKSLTKIKNLYAPNTKIS